MMLKQSMVLDVNPLTPRGPAKITYLGGSTKLQSGSVNTPTEVKDMPTIDWNGDPYAYYTLCKTDSDPNREEPYLQEWIRWLGEVMAEFQSSSS